MSHLHSIDEIKGMLLAQADAVIRAYAPPVEGSYEEMGLYYTLNPGRADRSVGSFVVNMSGARLGRWKDFATGQGGDILDLIALALSTDTVGALKEARLYLGLSAETAEDRRARALAAEAARKRHAEAERQRRAQRAKRTEQGKALWLAGREKIRGTPVENYLHHVRGIDLAALGRQPRALRYIERCFYRGVDRDTGEVIEGHWPAMLALMVGPDGRPCGCHRTYLAIGPDGRYHKAPLPKAKKVLGELKGAGINIWSGAGPRGGKGAPLAQCPPGTRLYLTEGIEDALSVVQLLPEARVRAAIALSNFADQVLPENVAEVVLVADNDASDEAKAQLQRAIDRYFEQGREVRIFRNVWGGKDLNDALIAARRGERAGAA